MDMSIQFKRIMDALFPHAHIICDRYHVCRLVDWAVERVRKREQHKTGCSFTHVKNRIDEC